jgi:hypothetical protein
MTWPVPNGPWRLAKSQTPGGKRRGFRDLGCCRNPWLSPSVRSIRAGKFSIVTASWPLLKQLRMLEKNGQVWPNSFLPRPPRRAPPARAPTRRTVYNTTRGVRNDRDTRCGYMSTSSSAHGVYEASYAWEPRRETDFWEDSLSMAASYAPSNELSTAHG